MRYNIVDNYKEACKEINKSQLVDGVMSVIFAKPNQEETNKKNMDKARFCFGLPYCGGAQ